MKAARYPNMVSSLRTLGLALVVAALVTGCASRKIPGTDIPDTDDTRAVIALVDTYRQALERLDADAILALLSDSFHDTGGTGTAEDDLYYRDMRQVLPTRLSQLENLRATFNIRTVDVLDRETATVVYHYDAQYDLPKLKSRPVRQADLMKMQLKKVGGTWKIASGI